MKDTIAAVVVPIVQLAKLEKLEATAIVITLGQGRKLFCVSIYHRPCGR